MARKKSIENSTLFSKTTLGNAQFAPFAPTLIERAMTNVFQNNFGSHPHKIIKYMPRIT